MPSISKTFDFHMAHRLPNHNGRCRRLHGHTYRVDIMVSGNMVEEEGASNQGMVVDFSVIKDVWAPFDRRLDHSTLLWEKDPLLDDLRSANGGHGVNLEDLGIEVTPQPPTAEYIAEIVFRNFWRALHLEHPQIILDAVRVWETPTSWALFDGRRLAYVESEAPPRSN